MKQDYSVDRVSVIILITYVLAGIGLVIGFLVLWMGLISSISSPSVPSAPLEDPLPDFTGFFIFIGVSFTGVGLFSILGNFLFSKRRLIGWFMLVLIYLAGTLVSGYILIVSLTRFFPLSLMSPMLLIYFLLFLLGMYVLYNLILNKTIRIQYFTTT
ncbi:MAG: hypothetical protein ACW981_15330 [Candidatus Hodarchaeales archaeon]